MQLAPGFAAQNVAEQSLPRARRGGVGGEGVEQGDGKGTLKIKTVWIVLVVSEVIEQLQPKLLHAPVGPTRLMTPLKKHWTRASCGQTMLNLLGMKLAMLVQGTTETAL